MVPEVRKSVKEKIVLVLTFFVLVLASTLVLVLAYFQGYMAILRPTVRKAKEVRNSGPDTLDQLF